MSSQLRHALLISDLHLEPKRPDISAALSHFLHTQANRTEALFVLGDLFEVWIGDDLDNPLADQIASELAALSARGVKIYLMHGNRDFLIGEDYARRCGAQLIDEPYVTEIAGQKMVLLHGDVLCTRDTDYMQFRAIVRQPEWQQNFLKQTVEQRLEIARQARQGSQDATANKTMEIMDVTDAQVRQMLQQLDVPVMIHGHTHRPAIHELQLDSANDNPSSDGVQARRIVLGDWHERLWYVQISAAGIKLKQAAFDSAQS